MKVEMEIEMDVDLVRTVPDLGVRVRAGGNVCAHGHAALWHRGGSGVNFSALLALRPGARRNLW